MDVMNEAFDPLFGEAWNRRQISDALTLSNCRCLLLGESGLPPEIGGEAAGL